MPEYATDPVTVHVKSCSICGSDLHLLSWGLPCTVGHEFAGVLDDGTPVAVQPYVPCGVCDQCLMGETARCRVWLDRFHGVSIDGGLADEVIVDRACLAVLPPEVPIENAALDRAARGRRCARPNNAGLTGAGDGDGPVLVIGAGSIGLAMTAVLRHRGYDGRRHGSPRCPARGRRAPRRGLHADRRVLRGRRRCGHSGRGRRSRQPARARRHARGGRRPSGIRCRSGSASCRRRRRSCPSSIYGLHNGRREFDDAVDVLAANPVIADVLVTHRFGLDDAPEAFATAADRAAGAIKVIIQP